MKAREKLARWMTLEQFSQSPPSFVSERPLRFDGQVNQFVLMKRNAVGRQGEGRMSAVPTARENFWAYWNRTFGD
jgi:hypothetical protein